MMSVTGCRMISHEELAVNLLNEKYNDSFEIENVQSQNYFSDYYTVIAYQESNPDMLFKAYVNTDGSGIADNFVCKIMTKKMSDKISQNLNNMKGIYYVFAEEMVENMMLKDVDITIDEYMKEYPSSKFTVYLNYHPESTDVEEIYLELNNMFKDLECVSGQVQLYIMDESMLKNVQSYVETNDTLYDEYHNMVENSYAGIIRIEKGQFVNSKEEIVEMLENSL